MKLSFDILTFLCWIGCRWRRCPWCKRFGYRLTSRNSSCTCCSLCPASISCFCWWYWWSLFRNPSCSTSRAYFFGWWFSYRMLSVLIYATIMISFWKKDVKWISINLIYNIKSRTIAIWTFLLIIIFFRTFHLLPK